MEYEILKQKIKGYEATFHVAIGGLEDSKIYEAHASFGVYVNEDEIYAEDVQISVFLGDKEVKIAEDDAEYEPLFEKIDEEINKHVLAESSYYQQEDSEHKACRAYDDAKDSHE